MWFLPGLTRELAWFVVILVSLLTSLTWTWWLNVGSNFNSLRSPLISSLKTRLYKNVCVKGSFFNHCGDCSRPPPQERGLQDDLNVIIFSDHGMTDIFWMDKVIELSKYVSLDDLQQVKDRGPVVSLWPAPGKHSEARHSVVDGR